MSQHDYSIANQGFPSFRADLNDALEGLVTNSSGATAPSTTFAHQFWVDTAANPSVLKIRNADNNAWVVIGEIDQTGDAFVLTSDVEISGGTIDDTPIGASTPSTGVFTDLTASGDISLGGYPFSESNMAGRNRIINGDMRIDQRNAGASVTVPNDSNFYTTDRWQVVESSSCVLSAQQVTDAPSSFQNSLKITVTTAAGSVGASETGLLLQRIEGFNTADLSFGTASASTITLSYWVKSSITGTFGGSLKNASANRSYPFSYTIIAANTWEQKIVTIVGDTSGTWTGATNGVGIGLTFDIGSGSSRRSTADAWAVGSLDGVTGATSIVTTLNATWQITGVQLEAGSVATPFERRQYGQELALCQRYFEKSYNQSAVPGTSFATGTRAVFSAVGSSTNRFFGTFAFAVPKRINGVSVTFYTTTGTEGRINKYSNSTITLSVSSVASTSENSIGSYIQTSTGDSSEPYVFHFTADAEL